MQQVFGRGRVGVGALIGLLPEIVAVAELIASSMVWLTTLWYFDCPRWLKRKIIVTLLLATALGCESDSVSMKKAD